MKKILFILLLIVCQKISWASHIVGGDVTYIHLGNNLYEFTINVYRDCLPPAQGGGSPGALSEDEFGYFSVYRGNNFFSVDSVFFNNMIIVPVNFSNDCINNPPATCLNRLQFKLVKNLPSSPLAYTFIYQRCCRNNSINNILNPGSTGATFLSVVPSNSVAPNSSAVFKNYPPQIICVNNPFIYDHSATDPDGDSLSYELCRAFDGGSENNPKPKINSPFIPFIAPVAYRNPFSFVNPMAGNPILKIDPVTGIMTGTPNIQGRFVVTVCVNEWRNGVMINTKQRDFQFVVTNCSKAVVANIPVYSEFPNTYVVNCKSYTVTFDNISTGGFKYFWDFGDLSTSLDTSSLFRPTYTYPDTGTYIVKLLVNEGSTCPDTISRIVKVYPQFNTDFDYNGLLCPESPISFNDKSTSSFDVANFWSWNFDDGVTSNEQNPSHSFPNLGKDFNVTLIAGNKYGCRDTITKSLSIPFVNVKTGNDTVIVRLNPIQLEATGAATYEWIPSNYLNNSFISNPIATITDTGTFQYIVKGITSNGCKDEDTINITVSSGPYLVIPNAFSPNGDGVNDYFRILASGYTKLSNFKIFDRWGKMVYTSNNFNPGWDGFVNGRRCELGTYFWYLNAIDLNGNSKSLKGDLILVQ